MSYNRHFFRNLNLGKESKPNPYKNDIIVDPRGQWNHPGQNTRIPGNEITMQGVPYPVWAQPNVGPGRMMQPGMNYTFPGAEYVDEIPMAQRGGATRRGYDPSTGRMISLSNVPGASIITDPSDPRMQMYMDSLNLYKAHQRQLQANPRTDTYDDRTDDLETFYTGAIGKDPNTTYFSDINEYKRIDAGRDRLLKKYGLHDDDELPDDAEEYRQRWTDLENDPEFDYYYPSMEAATNMALYKHPAYGTSWGDRDLADYYNSLSFYQPAVTGLWDTPDLGHSTILPSGKYFGGAWNPIYDKPKQPFYYEGNPKDLEKYRDQIMYSGVKRDWKGAGRPDAQYLRKKGTTDPKKSVTVNLIKSGLAKDSKSAKEVRKQLLEQVFGEELTGSAEQNTKLNKWLFDNPDAMERFKETGDIGEKVKIPKEPPALKLPTRTFEDIAPIDIIPAVANIIPHVRPGWTPDTGEHKFVEPIPGEPRQHHFNPPSFETEYRPSTIRPVFQREGGQIKIKESNKGKFTKKANAAGMSVQEFASKVLAATEGRYSASTRKQANFARNASKWKKQEGGDIMKYQIEGEVAPHVESTEPTEEEIFQATLDWFNTHPFADMPSMSDLSEIHGAESQVPKWKEMRGDKPGERYQGVYVPFANVTARPTVEGEKQKRGQFYYDTVPIEDGANRLNIVMVGDKPMVMPPTQGDMSNAEYRDITRMYDRFNKEYLHTYKKPARRKSGTSEVFHVYGAGLPYASDKSAWYEQYPSMNPDQQQDGGYIELELTDQEIEQYRKGGYIVEELPKAQEGIINLSGPRASKAEYLDIEDDVKEFADRYVTSEHHRNLLEKQGYPEDKIYWRMQDVLNYEPSLHTRFKTHGNSYVGAAGEGDIPLSLDSGQEAGMPVVSYNVLNPHPFPLDQVVSHEWGHIPVSTGFNPLTENERKEFINRLKPGVAKNEHDLEPQENRSDQFELRYFLDREGIYDSSKGEKFTQKHLDEYRKKTGAPNRMFKLYEDKDIIWLMNNIAATDFETNLDKAKYGGSLPKAQRGRTSGINYGSKAMELGADMLVASDPVQAKQYVIENLGYDPGDSTLIGNILHSAKRPASQPAIEEQLNLPPVDRGETLQGVAQQYIGGPDLKTVSTQAMIKQQQDAQKKEAVAQHYHAERLKDNPNYTIEEARELVNSPSQTSFLGYMTGTTGDIGGFAWEDYYNRERLWEHGPHTIRGISQAEWDAEHGPQGGFDKFKDIVYNPFTAAGFWARGQEIPDHMQRDIDRGTFGQYVGGSYITGRNPLDMVTDVTPIGAAHSADRIIEKAGNDISGDFWTMETGFDALNTVFHANMLGKANRFNRGLSYTDDLAGVQAANYANRSRLIGDPDLLNTGFKPLQKTLGSVDEVAAVTDDAAAFWGQNRPAASMEDWINEKGPKLFEGLKGKLKRKPKTGAPETPQSGTYEEIAVKDIIENATAGVPKTREHYFVGSNLFNPLTPGAARPPIYKLPEGISQQQFDAFASQVAAGEVPSTAVEAVFRAMVKANPELNNIKNVPKKDIINYASGHMPVEEMEEVHKRMSSDFWKSDQPSTSSIKEFSRKVNPLILEASGGLKDISPFTKGTKAAATEANEWLTNWIKDPATQSKISKMFDPHRKYIMNEYAEQIPMYEDNIAYWKALEAEEGVKYTAEIEKAERSLADAKEKAAGAPGATESKALNFEPTTKTYPFTSQLKDLIKGEAPIHQGNLGVMYPSGPRKGSWLSRKPGMTAEEKVSVGIHEGTHQWTKGNLGLLDTGELDLIQGNMKEGAAKLTRKWNEIKKAGKDPVTELGDTAAKLGYLADPTEVHARIMELRKHFDLKPGDDIDLNMAGSMLTEVRKGTTRVEKLFAYLFEDPSQFANLFNSLRVVAPIAGATGLGLAAQEQDGGYIEIELSDEEIEEYRKGGYIVTEV